MVQRTSSADEGSAGGNGSIKIRLSRILATIIFVSALTWPPIGVYVGRAEKLLQASM